MSPSLRAGVARAITTPPVGITHGNWGAQTHTRAEGVDLDLWATALVLEQGATQVAIVDIDLLFLTNDLDAMIRGKVAAISGIPLGQIRLSATHTHSGPSVAPVWYPDGQEMIAPYMTALGDKIAGAVWQAQRALGPARIAAGVGHSDVAMDRRLWHPEQERIVVGRNRDGFSDPVLPVARIDDEHEQPIAVLVNYACHPTIMAHGNSLLTLDYPGLVRRTVEQVMGGTCLFLQGVAGDQHPACSFSNRSADYRRVGTVLGLETRPTVERLVEVLESGADLGIYVDEPGPEPDSTLRVATAIAELPVASLPSLEDAEAASAQTEADLVAARAQGDLAAIRAANDKAKRANSTRGSVRRYGQQATISVEIQAMRIGDLGLVAMPGEPFAEIGVEIRRRSPFQTTMVSGYSNGYLGYIPMRADYAEGGYGVWSSPVGPGGDAALIEASVALLRRLA
jgi:hypothetical protein